MSPEAQEIITTAAHAMILAIIILMRSELKRLLTREIRDEIRKLCEWMLSDEFEALRAQVSSARALNKGDDNQNLR